MDLLARLNDLPIFPLPSVQLFPHAILPLHVFEPRYRALLRDALASDRVLAVAELEIVDGEDGPGERERGRSPSLRAVCGVGEVIAHEELPDGRSNILLHGLARARILLEEPLAGGRLYRVVRASRLDDVYPSGVDLGAPSRAMVAMADALAVRLPAGGDTLRTLARSHADPGALTDVLASALVTDEEERRRLLATVDVAARIEAVTAAIAIALTRFEPTSERGYLN